MISLTADSTHLFVSRSRLTGSNTHLFFPCVCAINCRTRARKSLNFSSLSLVSEKDAGFFPGFLELKRRANEGSCSWCDAFVTRCKKDEGWDSEGNFELEAEILNFMNNSEKPGVFPRKRDLMAAGRLDLVEAIVKQGGWLAMGWDLANDDDEEEEEEKEEEEEEKEEEEEEDEERDCVEESAAKNGVFEERSEARSSGVRELSVNSSSFSTSSSGGSVEAPVEGDSGVEGILNRLERERNLYLGISLREKGTTDSLMSNGSPSKTPSTLIHTTVGDIQRSHDPSSHIGNFVDESEDGVLEKKSLIGMDDSKSTVKSESWRSWSMRRAGFSDREFEAAEISSSDTGNKSEVYIPENGVNKDKGGSDDSLKRIEESKSCHEEINPTHIKSRLQYLHSELSSVLQSLRSNPDVGTSGNDHEKDQENSCDNLDKLSDAWEFQENEIMKTQDQLRSMRTKLAVLEGKMTLSLIDARRVVEDKQRRTDYARRALRLLRTACIVWPSSASEVLLAGSFDGWATKRRMEKSKTSVFTLWLKLYPGKYEIKFIVDGQWMVDPLRPIVNNSGYQNNLLIIT